MTKIWPRFWKNGLWAKFRIWLEFRFWKKTILFKIAIFTKISLLTKIVFLPKFWSLYWSKILFCTFARPKFIFWKKSIEKILKCFLPKIFCKTSFHNFQRERPNFPALPEFPNSSFWWIFLQFFTKKLHKKFHNFCRICKNISLLVTFTDEKILKVKNVNSLSWRIL